MNKSAAILFSVASLLFLGLVANFADFRYRSCYLNRENKAVLKAARVDNPSADLVCIDGSVVLK